MDEKFTELKTRMAAIWDLEKSQAVLSWDRDTKLPPKGTPARTRQISTLSRLIHEQLTSPEVGQLLEELIPWLDELDFDSDQAALIRLVQREYRRSTAVPTDLTLSLWIMTCSYSATNAFR